MNVNELLRDPVFQLNLLIWMTKEQPKDRWRVRPVFWELGFAILYIEQPFAFPVETSKAIAGSPFPICNKPEPDILLTRRSDGLTLYFEAKSNSFTPASSSSKQARAHLIATGPAFTETYRPLHALLCYVVPSSKRSKMAHCLQLLAQELKNTGLSPGSYSSHGLSFSRRNITYRWDAAFRQQTSATGDAVTVMKGLDGDCDPSPLLLVYTDEDCPTPEGQSFYRRVMLEQVRSRLLCDLHAATTDTTYTVSLDDLLLRTTEGVFGYLGKSRQASLRRLVRANVLVPMHAHWREKQPGLVKLVEDVLSVNWPDVHDKQRLLDWLEDQSTIFSTEKPVDEGPTLFDHLDNNATN